jgi:hypothetical protein
LQSNDKFCIKETDFNEICIELGIECTLIDNQIQVSYIDSDNPTMFFTKNFPKYKLIDDDKFEWLLECRTSELDDNNNRYWIDQCYNDYNRMLSDYGIYND